MAKKTGVYFIRDFVATPEEKSAAEAFSDWEIRKYVNASFVTGQETPGQLIKADEYAGSVPEIYRRWLEEGKAGPDRKLVGSPPAGYTGGKPTRLPDGSAGWPFGATPQEAPKSAPPQGSASVPIPTPSNPFDPASGAPTPGGGASDPFGG